MPLGNVAYMLPQDELIYKFNCNAGFIALADNPRYDPLFPSRTNLYYVTQTYNEIMNNYQFIISPATKQALAEKLWTYQQAVRDYEAGKQIKFPFIGGYPVPYTGDDPYTEPEPDSGFLPDLPPLPGLDSLTETLGATGIPKWVVYLTAGAATMAILKGLKVI